MCSTCILSFIKVICTDYVFYLYIVIYKIDVIDQCSAFIKVMCIDRVLNMYTVTYKCDVH